jgi:putative transposase
VPHPSFLRVRILSIGNPVRRYHGRSDLHFVTFSCYRRHPFLRTRRAPDQFVKVLDQLLRRLQVAHTRVRVRWKFPLIGYVVMPEHIHLHMGEPPRGDPSKVLQLLKQKVSRALTATPRKPLRPQMSLPFQEGETEAHP